MYALLKPLLFSFDPEVAHDLMLKQMQIASRRPFIVQQVAKHIAARVPEMPLQCMGLNFKHPVGLAAGLDKDARALPIFSALGFSGVELGTVTPKPQLGNDKPRLFRLLEDEGIVNRMGFNSGGVDAFLTNLCRMRESAVVGINIGKNAITPIEDAHLDYVSALQRVYSKADYVTINISSPNTKSLRNLQNEEFLDNLLLQITTAKEKCVKVHKRNVPIALKVAPDLDNDEVEIIANLLLSYKFDALIATNTTVSRPSSLKSNYANEEGGLSGAPVKNLSTHIIRQFYKVLKGKVQIIGVGGIANADDAWEKLLAGADYLQIYSQYIYQGPGVIREIVTGLQQRLDQSGYASVADAMGNLRD